MYNITHEVVSMKIQLKKGILENFVLGLLTHGDSYGYKIVQELSEVITISESTLYPILRRLEKRGSIGTYQKAYNGRLRKYYSLQAQGRIELAAFVDEWDKIKSTYDYILRKGDTL